MTRRLSQAVLLALLLAAGLSAGMALKPDDAAANRAPTTTCDHQCPPPSVVTVTAPGQVTTVHEQLPPETRTETKYETTTQYSTTTTQLPPVTVTTTTTTTKTRTVTVPKPDAKPTPKRKPKCRMHKGRCAPIVKGRG